MTEILRSPDDAVDGLAGYPTDRRRVEIPSGDGQRLRVHLVDTGPADAPAVVFLHGNPSWSYIWRRQIPAVVDAGYRAIAPDLVGMGMSDKSSEMTDHTVARHVEWMRTLLIDELGLADATFVLHDWAASSACASRQRTRGWWAAWSSPTPGCPGAT